MANLFEKKIGSSTRTAKSSAIDCVPDLISGNSSSRDATQESTALSASFLYSYRHAPSGIIIPSYLAHLLPGSTSYFNVWEIYRP